MTSKEVLNMPNQDGTGPDGEGPLTGRQRGKCKGAKPCPQPGMGRRQMVGQGRGVGRRVGRGRA